MEFEIRVRCKDEDKDCVRQALRSTIGLGSYYWSSSMPENKRTGDNYEFGFSVKYRNLKKVLKILRDEKYFGTNMSVDIVGWG